MGNFGLENVILTGIEVVFEFADGGDLAKYISKEEKLSENVTVSVMKQISQALLFLHSKKQVHRDVKPQNILIFGANQNATYKLADFGLAREIISTMSIQGTIDYMAPEIRNKETDFTTAVDIFSLGVVLVEALTGKASWFAKDFQQSK